MNGYYYSYYAANNCLAHHGVLGMKWGQHIFGKVNRASKKDRRSHPIQPRSFSTNDTSITVRKKDGETYLPKGTTVTRTAESGTGDLSNYRKAYVSYTKKDADTWEEYLGSEYVKQGILTDVSTYKTTKDLKILQGKEAGKIFDDMLKDTKVKDIVKHDIKDYYKKVPEQATRKAKAKTSADMGSRMLAVSRYYKSAQIYLDRIQEAGYDAVYDVHGSNMADNPLIILNPGKNLSKEQTTRYTKASEEYLKSIGFDWMFD